MMISHQLEKCMEIESISRSCYRELGNFASWLEDARDWADRRTHYKGLDEWVGKKNKFIHTNFYHFGLINKQSPNNDSTLWHEIYLLSPRGWADVSAISDYVSAFDQNNQQLFEIKYLILHFENKIK